MNEPGGPSRRDRLRAALVADIRELAYRQIADDGFAAVSMTGIAQSLQMTPAAIYRYFPSRDELVRTLIADSFEANAVVTDQALADTAYLPPDARLRHLLAETRRWAVANPVRYGIIQGVLQDNRIADADALVDPARRPFQAILSLVSQLEQPRSVARAIAPVLHGGVRRLAGGAAADGYTAEALTHALLIWSRLGGVINLEINGALDRMGIDATVFFDAELAELLPSAPKRTRPGKPRAARPFEGSVTRAVEGRPGDSGSTSGQVLSASAETITG